MRFNHCLIGLLLLVLSACAGDGKREIEVVDVASKQVTVQGSALIVNGDNAKARQAAIDDAVENAAQQMRRNNGAKMLVSDIKVVDEWQQGGEYHVQAVAVLSEKQLCASPYRKKLVATAFPIMNTEQLSGSESQDVFSGIPREISNRLMESGDFIARNQTAISIYPRPDLAPEFSDNGSSPTATILNIARQNDAQLVLSGVIRDFKIESTDYVRGSGIFAQMKWAMRDVIARRSVGIDVFVHDGFTGALVFQHRYTDSILGDVTLPSGYTVGSLRFDSTPAGHAVTKIVAEASGDIRKLFGCYPFSARVSQVNGNRVTIAAGAQDKIKAGDRMMVYSAGFSHNAGMGFSESLGILTIAEVGPTLAAGTIDASSVVRPGDWVRSLDTP